MRVHTSTGRDRRRWRMTRGLGGLIVVVGTGLAGCRQSSDALPVLTVYEVKGKVLRADGQPLGGGWITFVPKGNLPLDPSGVIGPDGTFSLSTGGSGEGAPPGEYKVRVEAPQFQQAGRKSKRKPPFPFKYRDEDSSGLVVTVRAETNQLEPIRLK